MRHELFALRYGIGRSRAARTPMPGFGHPPDGPAPYRVEPEASPLD